MMWFIFMITLIAFTKGDREYIIALSSGSGLSHDDAIAYCDDTYGTSLAVIKTEGDKANFITALNTFDVSEHSAWIGLSDTNTEGAFEWVDGTSCDDTSASCGEDCPDEVCEVSICCIDFWNPIAPISIIESFDCVVVQVVDDTLSAQTTSCTATSLTACNKPDGFNFGVGRQYQVPPDWTGGDANEARAACQSAFGTTLATVITDLDFVNIFNVLTADAMVGFGSATWIGLSDEENEGVWTWDDGSECATTEPHGDATISCIQYWDDGQPNTHLGVEQDCGTFGHRGLRFSSSNDLACNDSRTIGAVCNVAPPCNEQGLGLIRNGIAHDCVCKGECDQRQTGSHCNTIEFVAGKMDESVSGDMCYNDDNCCCSCPNCNTYVTPE